MSGLRVAVLGATGAVGREMWRLIESSSVSVEEIRAFAGARSSGTEILFRGRPVRCEKAEAFSGEPLDLVLASAGADASRLWSPRFVDAGAVVIDNSSAFREDTGVPLVVPEINAGTLRPGPGIVANPNCSTIQLVAALAPLHREWELVGVRTATYQSASGAGARAMDELAAGTLAHLAGRAESQDVFTHPIAFNVLPLIGPVVEEGESGEERKMRRETRRILDRPDLAVSAFCVRVPVFRGHSEAVWAAFARPPDPDRARRLLAEAGLRVLDDPARGVFPLPRDAAGSEDVFVGRVRRDPVDPQGLCLWVVADNLLKGAALNAWQIALALRERGLLGGRKENG